MAYEDIKSSRAPSYALHDSPVKYKDLYSTFFVANIYALLAKREVKMAGYWPSSFLRFYGRRRSRGL